MAVPLAIRQTFYENWPKPMKALAVRTASVALSADDVVALGCFSLDFRAAFTGLGVRTLSATFEDELAAALKTFPHGVMPRLGYASWKASMLENQPARTVRDVMQTISRNDPRIARALTAHAQTGEGAFLHLREFHTFPAWAEFRLFVQGKALAGASQYLYAQTFPEIDRERGRIADALGAFMQRFSQATHEPDVVADVFVEPTDDGFAARLIELNPLVRSADRCLYAGAGAFDGALRYRRADGEVVAVGVRQLA